jgi:hypothetical protein
VRHLVLAYYRTLRTVLKGKPHLWSCLRRCTHCRIFFLSDPRNRGRNDLRCPFGCRDSHRRKESSERSREYYGSPAGKEKKRALNGKRKRRSPADPGRSERPAGEARGEESACSELDMPLVGYLCAVVSLIEERRVRRGEVIELLRRVVRQRRFARERRIDYVVRTLKEKPP